MRETFHGDFYSRVVSVADGCSEPHLHNRYFRQPCVTAVTPTHTNDEFMQISIYVGSIKNQLTVFG
jgi:hypothetical protein